MSLLTRHLSRELSRDPPRVKGRRKAVFTRACALGIFRIHEQRVRTIRDSQGRGDGGRSTPDHYALRLWGPLRDAGERRSIGCFPHVRDGAKVVCPAGPT
jgi:hypothetical protein